MSNTIISGVNFSHPAASQSQAGKVQAHSAGGEVAAVNQEDSFVRSPFKPDMDKVRLMQQDLGKNINAFRNMVEALLKKQGNLSGVAFPNMENLSQILGDLTVDAETQAAAQAAIADDGEWGVEAVAGRILDFARALSGGDPSKIDLLRGAFQAGFAAAERVWGGTLPDISQRTFDRVMQGFDEWANEDRE